VTLSAGFLPFIGCRIGNCCRLSAIQFTPPARRKLDSFVASTSLVWISR